MTSTLRPTDEPDPLLAAIAGRSDRPLRAIPCSDPELAPTRRETVIRTRARMQDGAYRIDPRAVAGAIIERVSGR